MLLSLLPHSNTEYFMHNSLPHVPLPSDHLLLSLFSTQTLSILGITPYLMSLYPLITFFYLSFSTQTLSILGITPYLMSLYPLIILFYLSFPTQTLSILGITPYLLSLYPLIILLYLSSPLKH
jgi:hypothetical protein